MTAPVEDEFTELVDADFGRIDLVGKGANGLPFLVAKADPTGGLIPPALVHQLIGEHPTTAQKEPDPVTISGSPAAVMKMMHEAAVRASTNSPQEDTMPAAPVTKADDDPAVQVADLVPDAPAASTADSVPGSPDWEQLDADTASNVIAVLARVKGALQWLAGREATEQVTDGEGDPTTVWDLEDSASQIDYLIGALAGFATGEQLDAEMADEMQQVGKQAAGMLAPLDVVEQYAPVMKAGKVLSSANETAIRNAVDSLQNVLASLPAPTTDTVAKAGKEHAVDATDQTPASEPVEKEQPTDTPDAAQPVEKADPPAAGKTAMVAVYDAKGNLVGTVDPDDLSPIASATPPDGGDTDPAAPPAPAADPMQPAPAAAAGTPVAKAAADTDATPDSAASLEDVLKQMIDPILTAALEDHPVVKALRDKVAHLEAPARSRVLTNGQLPPAHQMRGQDHGTADVDVAKADDLRTQLTSASTVQEREEVAKQMQAMATAQLAALQSAVRAEHAR